RVVRVESRDDERRADEREGDAAGAAPDEDGAGEEREEAQVEHGGRSGRAVAGLVAQADRARRDRHLVPGRRGRRRDGQPSSRASSGSSRPASTRYAVASARHVTTSASSVPTKCSPPPSSAAYPAGSPSATS